MDYVERSFGALPRVRHARPDLHLLPAPRFCFATQRPRDLAASKRVQLGLVMKDSWLSMLAHSGTTCRAGVMYTLHKKFFLQKKHLKVTTFKKLMVLLEASSIVWGIIKHLLGWKMPLMSLLCCVLLNVLFLTLRKETWFFLGLLCSFSLAILGYVKKHSRSKATELALRRKMHSGIRTEDLQGFHTTQEETKASLRELDEMLSEALLSAKSVHRLLCWETRSHSVLFYSGLLPVLYLLYLAPGYYSLVAINSALFLWNVFLGRSKPINQDQTSTSSDNEGHSWGDAQEPEEPEEMEAEYVFKDALEEGEDEDDNTPLKARRGALVGQIPSIRLKGHRPAIKVRKLHLTNSSGNCSHCRASFSVLKKKKSCFNCGSSFCPRCCSSKVQKSCLDLTAPEALAEMVFVCTLCSMSLGKD
ncbi:hypothetical protein AAFF_G00138540 [Aldrovandia affinis]|uniref:FYVE-type domain-containing protein n=1 Tax=Aldrovandia affinis TaxID=143900 RepID=A0AAD7TC26_9TELE|nr:hypothetical protein AAFF_G00138540 [Aldrovandia affinis]